MGKSAGVTRTRAISWAFGLASVAIPTVFYLLQLRQFEAFAASREGYTCGMPLLAAMMISAIAGIFLSFIAAVAGFTDYRDLPRPRPTLRKLELVGVSIVLIGVIVAAIVTMLWAFVS